MPIYEYACTDCDYKLKKKKKMNDLPLTQCPACGQNTLKKLVSAAAFHLKGTGWYETDFSGKKKSTNTEETDTPPKEKTDTPPKTDTSSKEKSDTSTEPANKTSACSTSATD